MMSLTRTAVSGMLAAAALVAAVAAQSPGPEHTLKAASFSAGSGVSGLMSSSHVTAGGIGPIVPAMTSDACTGTACAVQAGFYAQASRLGVVPLPLVAAFSLYGNATAGSTGVPSLGWSASLSAGGASITVTLGGAAPSVPAMLFLSTAAAAQPLAGGAALLLVDVAQLLFPDLTQPDPFILTGPAGTASMTFANLPTVGIAGATTHAQWLVLDGASPVVDSQLGGIALTRALEVRF